MKIALANLNPTIGDLAGNASLISDRIDQARSQGAKLVVYPELAISGYPPKDLLLTPAFIKDCADHARALGESSSDNITIIFGVPLSVPNTETGLANSLVVYQNNKLIARYDKRLLPTYDVFDEDRYFTAGSSPTVIDLDGLRIGLSICEDLWKGADVGLAGRYANLAEPVAELINAGAQIIINPSASPFVLGKQSQHQDILSHHAKLHSVPILAVNQLGGNDELVFNGVISAVNTQGLPALQSTPFKNALVIIDTDDLVPMQAAPMARDSELLVDALTLGVRDYAKKTGFTKVCMGLSGGIDSALTAAIACRALGAHNVTGLAMPGKYSSQHSIDDAKLLADRLGCTFAIAPIQQPYTGYEAMLNTLFKELGERTLGTELPDLTEENLQSRVRGAVLMAFSNRTGALLLTTGNKSELAVGYCTLYGDMNGGLGVLADIPKNLVYEISRNINARFTELGFAAPPIPENTITKPPSAELAPDQIDADSLPPYDVLDEIVRRQVEEHQLAQQIIEETGFDAKVVSRIVRLIAINEYKRKQTPVGLKVTSVAFGSGRRMPIASKQIV